MPAPPPRGRGEDRLKRLRVFRDLTQQQLADLVGISKSSVERLERGDAPTLNLRHLVDIALVLGCESLLEVVEDEWLTFRHLNKTAPQPARTMLDRTGGADPPPLGRDRPHRREPQ